MNSYLNDRKAIDRLKKEYLQHKKLIIGFDFDNKEAKEKQLVKVYDLLDDYLDPENEEGGDLQSLYNDLSAEMEKNSFLSKMLAKEVQTAKKKPIKK